MTSASDCVLLHADAFRGSILNWNATEASATTSRDLTIEVSLSCPERPLLPTILYVSVPGIDFSIDPPRIVRSVEDLILLRVPVSRLGYEYDYFIYRPGGKKGPSLKLLPPHPRATLFYDEDVGLVCRGEERYTVAALLATNKPGVYDLHRFDSVTEKWSIDEVSLVNPQVFNKKNDKIPDNSNSDRLLFHLTSAVIPIGGESGTMGWVDLWRGILLCDVFSSEPKLRGLTVPPPLDLLCCNNGQGTHLGCPKSLRAIAFFHEPGTDPFLKFVHLGVDAVPIPQDPSDDSDEDWKMHSWRIETWRSYDMTNWYTMDRVMEASKTSISSKLESKMLKSGLLSPGGPEPGRAFKNLLVSFPALGNNDSIVYLQARVKFLDPKVFVLALDTKNNILLGAVEFATERICGAGVVYFPSNISKYIDPGNRVLPIPKDDSNWEESSQYEGTESLEFSPLKSRILRSLQRAIMGQEVSQNDTSIST